MKRFLLLFVFIGCIAITNSQNSCLQLEEPSDFLKCDDQSNDGFEVFDLTLKDSEILGSLDPTLYTVSYYETEADANQQINPLPNLYTNTSQNQIIYPVVSEIASGCSGQTTLRLTVLLTPSSNAPTPLVVCEENTDGFALFDLESKTLEIIGNEPWILVTYHESQQEAENDLNRLTSLYANTTAFNQRVYARSTRYATSCFVVFPLDLIVSDCSQNFHNNNEPLSTTTVERINFNFYPNPATTSIVVNHTGALLKEDQLFIFDIHGKKLSVPISKVQNVLTLDISSLSSGVYFIQLATNEAKATKRFVKR